MYIISINCINSSNLSINRVKKCFKKYTIGGFQKNFGWKKYARNSHMNIIDCTNDSNLCINRERWRDIRIYVREVAKGLYFN